MVKQVTKILFSAVLLLAPGVIYAQDLGSTTGLFHASNPSTKNKSTGKKVVKAKTTVSAKRTEPKPVLRTVDRSPKRVIRTRTTVARAEPENSAAAVTRTGVKKKAAVKTNKSVVTDEAFEQIIEDGNAARDERNYSEAERTYQKAQKIRPKDSRSVYGLGNVYSDQQRWDEAEKAYRQAIQIEPDDADAQIALSFVLTQPVVAGNLSDRYAEAESLARKAVTIDPTNAAAFDQLGQAMELLGIIGNETQKAYKKAIELDPTFALAHAHLGRLLAKNGSSNEAAESYAAAIRLSADVPTMILVAEVMQSQQKFAESEQLLRNALRRDPRNPSALFLLGRALTTSGNFEEAEALLKRSVEVSPTGYVSYIQLSSLYSRRGHYAQAETTLIEALKNVSPNERKRLASEFEVVGDGYMRLGKKVEARRVYEQAVSLDGNKPNLEAKISKAQ
jgi:Flp pilus assembly protein TadD